MGYESNVYYHPEKSGLETVGEIEWSEPDWSFDLTVVWKKTRGEYYLASDSGCSCPVPFDDYTSVESLEGPYTKSALKYQLEALVKENSYRDNSVDLLLQVRSLLDRIK